MSDDLKNQDGFDARLAARFEREHRHVPADAFVAATMRKVRVGRRRRGILRTSLRVAALVAIVAASPWLIAGVERLDAAVDFSLTAATGMSGEWVLGVVAILVVLAVRKRSR